MSLKISAVTSNTLDDLGSLLCTDKAAGGCWCMWFIIPVKEYHAAGSEGNRASFSDLIVSSDNPVGLLAKLDDQPVGWCAVGPRSRYVRAIKTPTYKGRDPAEDDDVWLVPCMFVRDESRRSGISEELLDSAVRLAKERGAAAIEGFPYSGSKRRSKETQVGFESVFSKCGFETIRTPSSSRVVVRLEF